MVCLLEIHQLITTGYQDNEVSIISFLHDLILPIWIIYIVFLLILHKFVGSSKGGFTHLIHLCSLLSLTIYHIQGEDLFISYICAHCSVWLLIIYQAILYQVRIYSYHTFVLIAQFDYLSYTRPSYTMWGFIHLVHLCSLLSLNIGHAWVDSSTEKSCISSIQPHWFKDHNALGASPPCCMLKMYAVCTRLYDRNKLDHQIVSLTKRIPYTLRHQYYDVFDNLFLAID